MRTQIRFVVVTGLLGAMLQIPVASGAPIGGEFPNFDKRLESLASSAGASAVTTPPAGGSTEAARAEALEELQARVPGAQVNRDALIQAPRLVRASRGFLTGKGGQGKAVSPAQLNAFPASDTHRVVKAFLNENSGLFGYNANALGSAQITRDYVTPHNGMRTTVWQQELDGIPVLDGLLTGNITRDEELISVSSQFVPDAAQAADLGTPNRESDLAQTPITARKAVVKAAANLQVIVGEGSLVSVTVPEGAMRKQKLQSEALSRPAAVQLVWLPLNENALRLCWQVVCNVPSTIEHYLIVLDAENGEVLVRRGLTERLEDASYNVFPSDSPSPFTPGWPNPTNGQPNLVERQLIKLSALDTNASPAGWVPDGPSPTTTGTNVDAFLCRELETDNNGNWVPDRPRPNATDRVFDFPLNLQNEDPEVYADASTVELFYWANWFHDRTYQLGFTEAAGNFQVTNFNRGGVQNDPVLCLVQAGANQGYDDNSAFYTPSDGISGECYMFVFNGPDPARDGSLDQEVVLHEMTHGLSSRLVGGGSGISALQTRGMGEGWSDFYALAFLSEQSDDASANYPVGGYVTYLFGRSYVGFDFTENYYYGIRRYPYSTDMEINPLTFKDIDPTAYDPHDGIPTSPLVGGSASEVHNQGEVWCAVLWEARANLIEKYGWQEGNDLILQLVTDAMKLSPANPTFLEERDAILLADEVNNDSDNFWELWSAFAKRGMGYGAEGPPSYTTTGIKESYDLPIPDGILEVTVNPPAQSAFFVEESVPIYVRVTDLAPVRDATIVATVNGTSSLEFRNDGVDPDQRANDSIYTATFEAPATPGTALVTMVISAPDKDTSTNQVSYYILAPPPNDNFADTTKIPAQGATYLTSPRRATYEFREPQHAGVAAATNSLWWDYAPVVQTNILIDTTGTGFRTVVAVYTGNTLRTLQSVASAVGTVNRPGAYVNFSGSTGAVYHISISSYDTVKTNFAALGLTVQPAGQPDTSGPIVSISKPVQGTTVNTNRVTIHGQAIDPGVNASGIKEITLSVVPITGNGVVTTTTITPLASVFGPPSTNWTGVISPSVGWSEVQAVATDCAGNSSAAATVQLLYRPIDPVNDFFANAIPLSESGLNVTFNDYATKEIGEPDHAGKPCNKSAWWFYRPPVDGVLSLTTTNSSFDTLLAIYTGNSVTNLTPVASNDDAGDGSAGRYSQIAQAVSSNTTYRIVVDGYNGASGEISLSNSFAPGVIHFVDVDSTEGGTVDPSSNEYPDGAAIALSANAAQYYEFDSWEGDISSQENPLAVTVTNDLTLVAVFKPFPFTDGFESGNLDHLSWSSGNDVPWIVQTNTVLAGMYAARSAENLGPSQTSSLILTTNLGAGQISFAYRVSSEQFFDKLTFSIDGGEPVMVRSGEIDWTTFQYPVDDGLHTLTWRYSKDAAKNVGEDAAYLDNLMLPLTPTTVTMVLTNVSLGGFDVLFEGNAGQQFFIQASTNLTSWQTISTNYATSSVVPFVDSTADQSTLRYYRTLLPQP